MTLAIRLRKLRSVAAVAACGSTVEAAERLHLSQSAVARAVAAVEHELGKPVFERGARGMRPTGLGRRLACRIDRALERLAEGLPEGGRPCARPQDAPAWVGHRLASKVGDRHLRVFLSLVATASDRLTAQAMAVSRSAVQQTLAQLEHMAGGALFERARGGLRPTDAGEALHRAARLALAELAQADEDVAEDQGRMAGRVVVGTLPFSTGLFLPRAVESLLSRRPGLSVTVIDGTYETLLHQLRYAELDLIVGALRDPPPGPDVQQETLFLDRLAVVARQSHPLAGRRLAGLRDLHRASWVMPMQGTPAQAAFEQAFQAERLVAPQGGLRVNSAIMMMALLAESDRVALMSSRQVDREVRAGLLSVLEVPVRHQPRRIGIVTRRDYLPATAAREMIAAIRAATSTLQS